MGKEVNYLLEKVIEIMNKEEKGKVLDIGCGNGDYSFRLKNLGFEVVALDIDEERFKYKDEIEFCKCDITKGLPFSDNYFDYIIFLEVIEHLRNPYFVVGEISRILKPKGILILSTPNILNLKSRLRFLFEGSWEYFREPPLDQLKTQRKKFFNIHTFSYRIHELEFLLYNCGFLIEDVFTSEFEFSPLFIFLPFIRLQMYLKRRRSIKKRGIDYTRIHRAILSKELLFGKHLILKAKKI